MELSSISNDKKRCVDVLESSKNSPSLIVSMLLSAFKEGRKKE